KNKNIKQKISFSSDAIIERKNAPMGIRADCTEMPTNMVELESIAKNSSDMLDFLKKIPEGSLQGFTFVTNSLSLHRGAKDSNGDGEVSPMWPRVLRSSIDGKTTISFVCDEKNPTFGKVEIIHFDDKDKEFKTTEFDFGHPNVKINAPQNRIKHNPTSCIACHNGSELNGKKSLKPNWGEYYQWSDCKENRGIQMYGGNDDNLTTAEHHYRDINVSLYSSKKCSNEEYKKQTVLEGNNFEKFRKLQKDNPCFNTLPWADATKDQNSFESNFDYESYPYAENPQMKYAPSLKKNDMDEFGIMNYSLRPNLRFTDTYSHLLAQQISNNLKKNSDYEVVKYLLVMEQAKCEITKKEINNINSILPNFQLSANYDGNTYLDKSKFLAQFAKHAGLKPVDWTMEFQEKKNSDYNAGMPSISSERDLFIPDVVGGEILKDMGKSNPAMSTFAAKNVSRSVTRVFGEKFSCIDDLGGGVVDKVTYDPITYKPILRTQATDTDLCKALRRENDLNIIKLRNSRKNQILCDRPNVTVNEKIKNLDQKVDNVISVMMDDKVNRGKKLIETDSKGKCVLCHSASAEILPKELRFIGSEQDPKKMESLAVLQKRKKEITNKLEHHLIKEKTMPPMANELTDEDRDDVKAYLMNLMSK
ncbi:MAG: cytochrome c, partial [Bacteriovorax sp.]|nr:cytochrome c [Bacteriovorax sp.]